MDELRRLRHETGADLCVDCGKCTSMCPLGASGDFSARRIAGQDLHDEIEGRGVGVGRCLTCASCEVRCPQGVRFTEFVRGLRELVPTEFRRPCPHGTVLRQATALMAGPGARPRPLAWLDDDLRIASEGEIALFVGCLPVFEHVFGKSLGIEPLSSAKAAIRLLNRLGIEPVVLDEERCCGHDLLWSGDRESFEKLAAANIEAFESHGVQQIISTCAECTRTWSMDYAALDPDYRPRVQHISQFLAQNLDRGELVFEEQPESVITYHDPCRLGRHLGVFDEPRAVLGAVPGAHLEEMTRHGRDSICCGTSGFHHCDAQSRRLQTERLSSARQTSATTLVTACPKCAIHFACAQHEDEKNSRISSSIEIVDLAVFMASHLRSDQELVSAPAGQTMGVKQ